MSWGIAALAVAVGMLLGVLGGGGGILLVPILVYLVHLSSADATASSLLIITITAVAALIPHALAGHTRWRQGAVFGVLGIAGSAVGSRGSAVVPQNLALAAFAVLLLIVAALMIRKLRRSGAQPEPTPTPRGWVSVALAATLVGLLTGFFGVGGGFIIVPALTLVLGFSVKDAVGTSLLVIAINGVLGLGMRAAFGHLDLPWHLVLSFTVLTVAGSLLGGWQAQRIPPRPLTMGFIALLLSVSAFMLTTTVPALIAA